MSRSISLCPTYRIGPTQTGLRTCRPGGLGVPRQSGCSSTSSGSQSGPRHRSPQVALDVGGVGDLRLLTITDNVDFRRPLRRTISATLSPVAVPATRCHSGGPRLGRTTSAARRPARQATRVSGEDSLAHRQSVALRPIRDICKSGQTSVHRSSQHGLDTSRCPESRTLRQWSASRCDPSETPISTRQLAHGDDSTLTESVSHNNLGGRDYHAKSEGGRVRSFSPVLPQRSTLRPRGWQSSYVQTSTSFPPSMTTRGEGVGS